MYSSTMCSSENNIKLPDHVPTQLIIITSFIKLARNAQWSTDEIES